MKRPTCGRLCFVVLLAILLVFPVSVLAAGTKNRQVTTGNAEFGNDLLAGTAQTSIADPLEPVNRFFFQFNDRFYFWLMKPVASRYAKIVPADIRTTLRNGFDNLLEPMRMINCLLQGRLRQAGIELSRFLINSTAGVAGLADPAGNQFGLRSRYEDMGQTLGRYGLGGGIYFVWPFLGPSNLRDSFGDIGDFFLEPLNYILWNDLVAGIGVTAGDITNRTSFKIGEYEAFKEAAFDPYLALRNAYEQHRKALIENRLEPTDPPVFSRQPPGKRSR